MRKAVTGADAGMGGTRRQRGSRPRATGGKHTAARAVLPTAYAVVALAVVLAGLVVVAPAASAAQFPGYPGKDAVSCGSAAWCKNGSSMSERGYYYKNCTDWASWRLQAAFGVPNDKVKLLGHGGWWSGLSTAGDAVAWRKLNGSVQSRGITVNRTPAVGAAAVTRSTSNDPKSAEYFGHVAVIEAVSGASVTVSEYNGFTGEYTTRTGTLGGLKFTDVVHFEKFATKGLPNQNPVGNLDSVKAPAPGQVRVGGWAADPDVRTTPLGVHVYVGGKAGAVGAEGHAITANGSRRDVGAAYPGYGNNHGFDATFETRKTGATELCVYAINVPTGTNPLLGCRTVAIANPDPFGSVDSVRNPSSGVVSVGGWSADASSPTSAIDVHIYIGGPAGTPGAEAHPLTANLYRRDVGTAYPGYGNNHGFGATYLTAKRGSVPVCAHGINVGTGRNSLLGCKTIKVS